VTDADLVATLERYAASCGEVFATFEAQDSACVSFGVDSGSRRWFIKGPTTPVAADRVASAIELHARVRHAVIVRPVEVTQVGGLPVLRYPWVDGDTLYPATTKESGSDMRKGDDSPHQRFRRLPVEQIVYAIDAVYAAHVEVSREGYVAVDLYDGCLRYDFDRRRMKLIDLDEYRPAPVVVPDDPLPGSTSFQSPEQARPGAVLDERSTVYTLGRLAQVLLDEGDDEGRWRGGPELGDVARRATAPDPSDRFGSVTELTGAWRAAASIAD
jgi:serine/threonine-protein kinase